MHGVYRQGKVEYGLGQIEVLVAHIRPCDAWYVLRAEDFRGTRSLQFYPHIECKAARWEKYRDAWHLLQLPAGSEALGKIGMSASSLQNSK